MNNFFNFISRHRYDIFFGFILILLISFAVYIFPKDITKNIINTLENKTFDIRQNITAKDKSVSKDIIIITVDDPSYEYLIEKYGDWPIPRHVYGELVEYIQAQKPKFVAFDLIFVKSLNRIPGSDKKLVDTFKKYDNLYTGINFDDFDKEVRTPPILDSKLSSNVKINSNKVNILTFTNCRLIHPNIIDATDKIGHINSPKSDDGYIRTLPLIINYKKDENSPDEYYLYMTLKIAIDYINKYENENIKDIVIDKNNNLVIGKRKLPLTNQGEVILNWYGDTGLEDKTTFKYISFWEVLKSIEAKKQGKPEKIAKDLFKDKIVYIGTNVFSLSDIKTVPTSKYLPGVEIHATLLNNILDKNLIHKASLKYNILITVLLGLLGALTVYRIRSVFVSIAFYTLLNAAYLYFATFVMSKYHVWIWIIIPITVSMFIFICTFIIKYLIKSRDFEYTYKLATTDGLTELYNHRFFQEQIRLKIKEADKTKSNFSLIIIDIDFFKKFNDKYGHQAGDAVLKNVAKTLKSCVRSEDMVCRYGGEEMTIILSKTNKETAINIAQKICSTVAEKKYQLTPELEVNVTISLGVSSYPTNGKTPQTLIEYADKCLYQAKENGRNRVGFIEE